mgnify:CR=1 FL=1
MWSPEKIYNTIERVNLGIKKDKERTDLEERVVLMLTEIAHDWEGADPEPWLNWGNKFKCPSCGATKDEKTHFCPECGKEMER